MSIADFSTRSMSQRRLRAVALLGPLPLVGVAAFQVSLSLGARYGDAALDVEASTQPPPRCGSEGGALLLLGALESLVGWPFGLAASPAARRGDLRGRLQADVSSRVPAPSS